MQVVDQFCGTVLVVGSHKGSRGKRLEDLGGHLEKIGGRLGHGACGGADCAADGLLRIAVQREEHLRGLHRLGAFICSVPADVSTGVAGRSMGVDEQESSRIFSGDPADFSERDLESLGLCYGVAVEQKMHRRIGCQKRKPIEHLETSQSDAPSFAGSPETQGRLVDQLQGQSRFDPRGRLLRPAAQQVPCAQPEVFWNQEPQAYGGVADFIGESLSDAAFEADRIAVGLTNHLTADLSRDLFGCPARPAPVEFFFAGHTRR